MSYNNVSALNPTIWRPMIQDFLNNNLVGTSVCQTKFEEILKDGQAIEFPYNDDLYVQDYTPGTDLVSEKLQSTSNTLLVNKSKAIVFTADMDEQRQARADYITVMSAQAGFRLSNQIDKEVISAGVNGAFQNINAGSVNASQAISAFTDAEARLAEQNATDGELFAIVSPGIVSQLEQTFVSNGFNMADLQLRNHFIGQCVGFNVYRSNNIPCSNTLEIATNPTDGDTVTLFGTTFTFKSTPLLAGAVKIGVDATTTYGNLKLAINGTGVGDGSDYVEISNANRLYFKNNDVLCGVITSHIATITGVGRMNGSSSLTAGSPDGFGTEQTSMLFGRTGAISLAMQILPTMKVVPKQLQLADNILLHTLYGTKVFERDSRRLVKYQINATNA